MAEIKNRVEGKLKPGDEIDRGSGKPRTKEKKGYKQNLGLGLGTSEKPIGLAARLKLNRAAREAAKEKARLEKIELDKSAGRKSYGKKKKI